MNYAGTILTVKGFVFHTVNVSWNDACAIAEVEDEALAAGVTADVAGSFCLVFF